MGATRNWRRRSGALHRSDAWVSSLNGCPIRAFCLWRRGGEAPAKGDIPQWSRERNEGNQRVVGWTKFNVSTFNAISYVILEPTLSGFAPTSRAINAERWAIVATQNGEVPDMMCPLPHDWIDAHELNAP